MSISSVPASPTPVNYNYPDPDRHVTQTQGAPATAGGDANEASVSQPVQAPLPPGQGTRINQLV